MRRFSGLAAVFAAWLTLLSAAPAHAKKPDKPAVCKARCERIEQAAQEELNECVRTCPKARRGQMEEHRACAQTCTRKLKGKPRGIDCIDSCESGELDKPKKKKSAATESRHKDPSAPRPKRR